MMRVRLGTVVLVTMALVAAACTGAKPPQELTTGGTQEQIADGGAEAAGTPAEQATEAAAEAAAATAAGATTAAGSTDVKTTGTKTTVKGGGGTVGVPGGAPTNLFTAAEDKVGITKDRITMCAHAALTYGAAFNTSADDLNVFWSAINDKGGVYGRKVDVSYENDNYSPDTAVQAATACKGKNIFMLLGGIGFDQIPAVRNWAETNRMLYMHHTATVKGSEGKQFSFTALPTTEKMGEMFGELAVARYRNKKVGIIRRNSPNWDPGVEKFKEVAAKYNVEIVEEKATAVNQGNYNSEILAMKDKGVEVVFGWENALAALAMVRQAKAQQYHPTWMLFPFNLTSQGVGDEALSPKMAGIAMFPAYSYKDYSGPFAPYASDMKEFEVQYAKYRPNADLKGVGGDLLFLNWTAQKAMYDLLLRCGADCGKNRFIDTLIGYKSRPFPAACDIDFTRPGAAHLGSYSVNVMETYKSPGGDVNWRNTDSCVEHLL